MTSGEIQPKNGHCLRGLNGKYGRWDEILRDLLNGKLKIVQNRKKSESETEDEDDDDEDQEMPEATETSHTTHPYETEDMPRFKQIRRMMQYKSTLTVRYLVRI